MKKLIGSKVQKVIGILLLIFLWWIGSLLTTDVFIPSPKSVADAFIDLAKTGQLLNGIAYSFCRIFVSAIIAMALSIPIAIAIFVCNAVRSIVFPVVSAFRFVPITAFSGLFILWMGLEEGYKIGFLTLASFVYMLPSVLMALEEVPVEQIEAARALGFTKWGAVRCVVFPIALPSIASSFLMMIAIGCNYINVVESVNAKFGLGFTISVAAARGKTPVVFAAIFTIMAISFAIDAIGRKVIRSVFQWRYVDE